MSINGIVLVVVFNSDDGLLQICLCPEPLTMLGTNNNKDWCLLGAICEAQCLVLI